MEHVLFRGAVGGFHRKDVMEYLEVLAKEHGDTLQACKEERDAAQAEACRLVGALAQAEERTGALEAERTHVMEAWDGKQAELDALGGEVAALQEELQRTRAALCDCRKLLEAEQAQVAALQTEAASYASVKDRLSNIELSAHQRAAEVERAAELEAENIQRKAKENVLSLQMQYELAMSSLDAGRRQVTEHLCDMQMALDTLAPVLEQSGRVLVALCEERCKGTKQGKEPGAPGPGVSGPSVSGVPLQARQESEKT